MDESEALRRAAEEREDRDRGIVKDPDRYVRHRGKLYSLAEMHSIFALIAPRSGETIADLGCGVGRVGFVLAQRVGRVIGVDFSTESIGIFRARCAQRRTSNIEAHVADLRQLPIAENSCDAAISIQVIQHIPSDAWRLDALREARRILKPGGRFAFTVYQFGTMIRGTKEGDFKGRGYRLAFTPEEVLAVLAQAGFIETRVTGVLHLPHPLLRYLPGSLWPLEAYMSRAGIMTPRATYLLGYGVKPD